jgi:hypothetical protein
MTASAIAAGLCAGAKQSPAQIANAQKLTREWWPHRRRTRGFKSNWIAKLAVLLGRAFLFFPSRAIANSGRMHRGLCIRNLRSDQENYP